ncbi:selenide, water dikinase SelD [Pararhodobacter oceanensis]|uniref:selenide, water dikinase SelD n=1 Tax=Pararhodobacter oceanensis TaxID=2172121 RepID=UPI003A8CFA85
METLPFTRDLVFVGGGHAHALALLKWAMDPLPGARLTLIDPNPTAPYTGMLPGHIAGHYKRDTLEMNLVALARHVGARLILGRAEGIDLQAQKVLLKSRPPVAYDVLSLDIGITSDLPDLPGFTAHATAAKPLGQFAESWAAFLRDIDAGRRAPHIAIIGAGVAGVELALAMAHRLAHIQARQITLIERETPLPNLGQAARQRLLSLLTRQGVDLIPHAQAARIEAQCVTLTDGRQIAAGLTLGAAGSRPQPWLQDSGLHLTEGFVTVDATLRSTSHAEVFAVGDCAHMQHAPRPKAGVFAVRQAPVLTHNLRAALSGASLRRYQPQRDYLKLVSLGGKSALADKWGLPLSGRWLWRIKDGIDAKFMRKFNVLPQMPRPQLPQPHALDLPETIGEKPMCGGCGAKVGPNLLRQTLTTLGGGDNVVLGAGDDAAILRTGGVQQVLATDHLRAVSEDAFLMAKIAATHALGDIWAMGATPQAALASLVLPRQSEALQARQLVEIMAGLTEILTAAGAPLVGGHTTLGAELTIGVTLTGLAPDKILTKAGAQAGDALILTKPIGSGTLLAAEMGKAAEGRAIAALWQALTHSQAEAADILVPHAHAMTDVTGFGLAGHLDEMLRASQLAATLSLDAVPLFTGAEALAASGTASTIAPANRAALIGRISAPANARTALLFDPQTAGGLLAAVPQEQADTLLTKLHAANYPAAIIGSLHTHTNGSAITAS